MTDAEKLEILADWFDANDKLKVTIGYESSNEVQDDIRRIANQLESEQPKKMRTMLQDAINESDQLQQQEVSEGDMIKEISMSGNSWLSDYAFGFRHGVKWMQSKLKGNG